MLSQFASVIIFATAVGAVYATGAAIGLRILARRSLASVSRVDRIVLILAAVGVLCIGYGYFIEPNSLATTHVALSSSKVLGKRPIRIVHFSDLHSESRPRLEPRLIDAVAAEHPDLILFTGDSINSPDGVSVLRNCIAAMAKIAPTFVVRGNWDTGHWSAIDLFGGAGATELNGDAVRIVVDGTPVWIAGFAFDNAAALQDTLRTIPKSEFAVVLYHSPDLMPEVAAQGIDLFCAGHTHGGQVALPFYGAMITFSKFGKRYEAGLYHEKNTWLYVNRGIGMEGGSAPRVRFWSKPELTVIDIRPVL